MQLTSLITAFFVSFFFHALDKKVSKSKMSVTTEAEASATEVFEPIMGNAHKSSRPASLPPLPKCVPLSEESGDEVDFSKCLFSVGLIADPQYADMDDRYNYTRTALRHYRNGTVQIARAVNAWNNAELSVVCCGFNHIHVNIHKKSCKTLFSFRI